MIFQYRLKRALKYTYVIEYKNIYVTFHVQNLQLSVAVPLPAAGSTTKQLKYLAFS